LLAGLLDDLLSVSIKACEQKNEKYNRMFELHHNLQV
jgi:hypothetical protein